MNGSDDPKPEVQALSLGPPPTLPRRRGHELTTGIPLDPVKRIGAFSPDDLENLVEYWLREKLSAEYARIVRWGSTGDKGRDVVGHLSPVDEAPWDNYQCKRYESKLTPGDLWPDLAKLVYWTFEGSYVVPRRYSFVSPKGATAKARELLSDPDALRKGLAKKWDRDQGHLCSFEDIENHLTDFKFPDFGIVVGSEIVEDLKGTGIYSVFFGGGLSKPRPTAPPPPSAVDSHELGYVNALVDAYEDHCGGSISTTEAAFGHGEYGPHLRRSRIEFYRAESLREFSKDVLVAPDSFEELQGQILDGIRPKVAEEFASGYDRVLAVSSHSVSIQLSNHPLRDDVEPADRVGICHQLANDGKVKWRR